MMITDTMYVVNIVKTQINFILRHYKNRTCVDENFETALNYVTFPLNDLDARITDYILLPN